MRWVFPIFFLFHFYTYYKPYLDVTRRLMIPFMMWLFLICSRFHFYTYYKSDLDVMSHIQLQSRSARARGGEIFSWWWIGEIKNSINNLRLYAAICSNMWPLYNFFPYLNNPSILHQHRNKSSSEQGNLGGDAILISRLAMITIAGFGEAKWGRQ